MWVHYTTSCKTRSSATEDGRNNCPKHVELTGIINKPLLLRLVDCLYCWYQWCTVKQISDNEIYLLVKYIKSVLWRVAKRLSYIEDARCLKIKSRRINRAYSAVTWYRVREAFLNTLKIDTQHFPSKRWRLVTRLNCVTFRETLIFSRRSEDLTSKITSCLNLHVPSLQDSTTFVVMLVWKHVVTSALCRAHVMLSLCRCGRGKLQQLTGDLYSFSERLEKNYGKWRNVRACFEDFLITFSYFLFLFHFCYFPFPLFSYYYFLYLTLYLYFECQSWYRIHHHHHLSPWVRSIELFRHRRFVIVSCGVHDLFFLQVCSWGRVSGVWCCQFF